MAFKDAMQNIGNGIKEIGTGMKYAWYNFTGRSYLTPDAQHREQREDTAIQRAAADTEAAGLSKYGGVSPADSSGGANGLTALDAIQQLQSIKQNSLNLKETKYNLDMSKKLGIRTGDTNELSKAASIVKLLLGYDVGDVGEHGLLGMLFPKIFGGSTNGAITGAAADTLGAAATNPLTTSYGLAIPDTYDRSRVAHQVVTGNASLEDFSRAYQKVALAGLNDLGDGKYKLNEYGISVLKGVAKMTSSSPSDVMSSFQNYFWDMKRRLKENDELPSSTLPPAAGGGGSAW